MSTVSDVVNSGPHRIRDLPYNQTRTRSSVHSPGETNTNVGRIFPRMPWASTIVLISAPLISQPPAGTAPSPAASPATATVPKQSSPAEDTWSLRLAGLDGRTAAAYFELAEEVADSASTIDDVTLAQRLFVLAFELDRARTGTRGGPLAASCCLGLASLSRREPERRWLVALAGQIDPRHAAPPWLAAEQGSTDARLASLLAMALGLLRAGEGTQAAQIFADPAVKALLARYERLLSDSGLSGLSQQLALEANRWPCPDCGNSRAVKRTGKANDVRLCPTCAGNPGPRITDDQLVAQLRLESLLLSGIHRSWGAQIGSDNGEPLRDPDVNELAPTFNIDPSRSIFVNSAWSAPNPVSPPLPTPPAPQHLPPR